MKKIKVNLDEKTYSILLGAGYFNNIVSEIKKLKLEKNKILLIIDKNVDKHHSNKITKAFKELEKNTFEFYIKADEKLKSLNEVNRIYNFLLKNKFGRDTLIISIGGGLTGDIAGYTASTYMRGVPLIHIPTTLLSSLDSSIGGKNGINLGNLKNIIGTFYQPKLVLIDPEFLLTLPKKEMVSGIGEILKYTLLANYNLFFYVNNNLNDIISQDVETLENIIYRCASLKTDIIEQDEHEASVRRILNLGHTFAHSFESSLNFKVKHGEAVIAGLISSLHLANKKNLLPDLKLDMFLKLLNKIKLSKEFNKIDNDEIIDKMLSDKKNTNGKINFVLLKDIGNTLIDIEANKKEISYSLEKLKEAI